ncbi:MAG: hypothetical protein QGG40_18815, partial [Myxococcota bacterium]|nr:hypothetical protein [Myxococcota bacterium]
LLVMEPEQRLSEVVALGPSSVRKLLDELPVSLREAEPELVAQLEGAHFGRLLCFAEANGLAPVDDTEVFRAILEQVKEGASEFPQAAADRYVYLFVPGLVTEHQPGYFSGNLAFMESRGLDARLSTIDTDAGICTNASYIRQELAALDAETGRPIIVVAHSKGVPDAARALQDESTERLVAALLPMQGVVGGTPLADAVMEKVGTIVQWILDDLLGAEDGRGLSDLTFSRSYEIFGPGQRQLELPVFAFVSSDHERVGGNMLLLGSSGMRDQYGVLSDGLVPVDSQKMHGRNARFACVDDMNHADTVHRLPLDFGSADTSPGQITEAHLTWALRSLAADEA